MRKPSPRVLNQTVDLYRLIRTRSALDADGGLNAAACYPGSASVSAIPCAVNPEYAARIENDHGTVNEATSYTLIFATDPDVNVLDKIVWVDGAQTHTMFATGAAISYAGRGVYGVVCVE